jgi:hypothetical protein
LGGRAFGAVNCSEGSDGAASSCRMTSPASVKRLLVEALRLSDRAAATAP